MPFAPVSEGRGRSSSLDEPWPVNQPIRLCAIRVDFVPDEMTGTTGDGTFGSGFPDTLIIDPLPHDKQYFEDHLSFLDNYFSYASKNNVTFSTKDVYPAGDNTAYRLPYPMWHYNFNSDTALLNRRLVELFAEATTLAAQDVDFGQYDAIVIFHAGVGKDFNIGLDNTPFDIPSAYISQTDIQRYGVAVPANVTRGILLPEGQNQAETLEFEIELSLNGVMVKLFGNWLGMPDLFNTETGASGIGRWGMMDQGSGNVNAIVPALPDAWSRVFMGWSEAQTVIPTGTGDSVSVARFGVAGAPEVLKIPALRDEYYLIENRDADADSIGYVTVYDRDDRQMRFYEDGSIGIEENFRVAVRASHYDYGIPGSGILIWHIVENVIDENYATNRINADPDNRGVELVEADGSRDIGREYGFATVGSGTELGIQEDCWYRDNRDHRDANGGTIFVRFNDNTHPSARLRDHSFTGLALSDFTDVGPIMSLRVRNSTTLEGFPLTLSPHARWCTADLDGDMRQEMYFQSNDSLFKFVDSILVFKMRVPVDAQLSRGQFQNLMGPGILVFTNNTIGLVRETNGELDSLFREIPPELNYVSGPYVCQDSLGNVRIVVQSIIDDHLYLMLYDEQLELKDMVTATAGFVTNVDPPPTHRLFLLDDRNYASVISINDELTFDWTVDLQQNSTLSNFAIVHEPGRTTIYDDAFGYFDSATGEILCAPPSCLPPQVDWDGDGRIDGGGPDGADYTPREDFTFIKSGVKHIHDLNFDGMPDIFQVLEGKVTNGETSGWRVSGYDHQSRIYSGYPLVVDGSPVLLRLNFDERRYHILTEVRTDEYARFSVSRLPTLADGTQEVTYEAPDNVIIIGESRPQVHDREDFAYVWPNPSSGIANIRLTLPYAAEADVNIFDLAGRRIAQLTGRSNAAGPFEIQWNTHSVQSGVYIGRVEARGGGQTSKAELKIAVVR